MDRLEWWNYAVKNGTRGDMVLDILEDWEKSDAKTAHLVAQEIFTDLDHLISTCYTDHIQDYYAIKSKWGIE